MDNEKLPKATHQGKLTIVEGFSISCAVLNDDTRTRVFSERSLANSFGIKGGGAYWERKKQGGAVLPEYLSAKYLKPYISKELETKLSSAISYISTSGVESSGIQAELLSDICDVYIQAYQDGHEQLKLVAENSYKLIKALSKVAVIALIDEATGYMLDKDRSKDALQIFLKRFLQDEAAGWVKTFKDEFFEMIFRMKGWDWLDLNQKPGVVGKYINDLVYARIAPGVLEELRVKNPTNSKGMRGKKHHQYLSRDMGHPKLKEHIEALLALGKVSNYNWKVFNDFVDKAYPKFGETLKLDFPETIEEIDAKNISKFDNNLITAIHYKPKKED